MKRFLQQAVVSVGVCFVGTSLASAQGTPAPRAKVAVVNYGMLFTQWEKAQDFKKTLDESLKPLKKEADEIKAGMQGFKAILDNPNTAPDLAASVREQFEELRKRLEELEKSAREKIGKKQQDQLTALWLEIKNTIADYAKSQDFDVVLAYGDPPTDLDGYTNINRKMGGMDVGSTVPVYVRPGAEISNEVLRLLNEAYRAQKKQAAKAAAEPKW